MKKTLTVLMVLLFAMLVLTFAVSCNPEQKKTVKIGDVIELGTYPTEAGETYAGKPITWKVLEVDGSKALVISEKILTKKANTNGSVYKWSTSPIRSWLNSTEDTGFISQYGLGSVSIVEVSNTTEEGHSSQPEETTTDRVFLLSVTELDTYSVGDAYYFDGSDDVYWWLRTPCKNNAESDCYCVYPADAGDGGHTNQPTSSDNGVRPAFWINL
jgi:hypothetical protein